MSKVIKIEPNVKYSIPSDTDLDKSFIRMKIDINTTDFNIHPDTIMPFSIDTESFGIKHSTFFTYADLLKYAVNDQNDYIKK